MKKIITLVALVFTTITFAQEKISEGVATTKMTMSSTNEQMNAQLAMMGETVSTTYFKGSKSRTEANSAMTGESISIIDKDSKDMLMLVNHPMMGKKYVSKKMETTEEATKGVEVTKTEETKEILGYQCTKYQVALNKQGVEVKMDVYATDKLTALSDQTAAFGDKLKGFPLLMVMHVNQMGADMVINYEVTAVKAEKVADDKFDMTVPEGYSKQDKMGM